MFTVPAATWAAVTRLYVGQNHEVPTALTASGRASGWHHPPALCYCAAAWVVLFFVRAGPWALFWAMPTPAVTPRCCGILTVIGVLFCINDLLMDLPRNTLRGLGYSVQAVISGIGQRSSSARALRNWLAVRESGLLQHLHCQPHCLGSGTALQCLMVTRLKKRTHKIPLSVRARPHRTGRKAFCSPRSINIRLTNTGREHCSQHTGHSDGQAAHGFPPHPSAGPCWCPTAWASANTHAANVGSVM